MGYGYDKVSEKEKLQYDQLEFKLEDQLGEEINAPVGNLQQPVEGEVMDTFAFRYKESLKAGFKQSVWFDKPALMTKQVLDLSMDSAQEDMETDMTVSQRQKLSSSQKSKRGERFRSKAQIQSEMIKGTGEYLKARKGALKEMLPDNAEVTDENEVMLNDIAAYYSLQAVKERSDEKKTVGKNVVQGLLNNDSETANTIIKEIKDLSLDQFAYKNDKAFLANYASKIAILRMYSHGEQYRSMLPDDNENKYDVKITVKIKLINEILEDYESRAKLVQSPYYTLMAGKDIDKLTDDDLVDRIYYQDKVIAEENKKETPDEKVIKKRLAIKEYMGAVLSRRQKRSFGKGQQPSDLEKKALKEENLRLKKMYEGHKKALIDSTLDYTNLSADDEKKIRERIYKAAISEDNSEKANAYNWPAIADYYDMYSVRDNSVHIRFDEDLQINMMGFIQNKAKSEDPKGNYPHQITLEMYYDAIKDYLKYVDERIKNYEGDTALVEKYKQYKIDVEVFRKTYEYEQERDKKNKVLDDNRGLYRYASDIVNEIDALDAYCTELIREYSSACTSDVFSATEKAAMRKTVEQAIRIRNEKRQDRNEPYYIENGDIVRVFEKTKEDGQTVLSTTNGTELAMADTKTIVELRDMLLTQIKTTVFDALLKKYDHKNHRWKPNNYNHDEYLGMLEKKGWMNEFLEYEKINNK